MKPAVIALSFSLVANAVLVCLHLNGPASAGKKSVGDFTAVPVGSASPAKGVPLVDALLTAALKSGDPKLMREALQKAGFPPDYVRDIIMWELADAGKPDRLALLQAQLKRPPWVMAPTAEELALQEKVRKYDAKSYDLAKEVFGGKVPPHPLEALDLQRRYGFLAPDRVDAVVRIDSDYNELATKIRQNDALATDAEVRENLRLLDQEKRTDLAKPLTPAELELYDLNLSPTADALRRQLTGFQTMEEEFSGLYQICRTFDEKNGGSIGALDAGQNQEMQDQFHALLGDLRYAEFKLTQDYGYRAASEIATLFNLPLANAVETYALQQSMNQRMQEARTAAGNDRAALAASAQALATEANAKLTALLGVPGLDAYKKTGGAWLRSLEKGTILRPAGG